MAELEEALKIEQHGEDRRPLAEEIYRAFLNAALELLKSPIQNLERWSLLTLVLVAVSVMTVVVGGILAMMQGWQTVQLVSSVSSIITSVIGGLVMTQLRASRAEVMASRDLLLDQLSKAGARLFGERAPVAFYYTNQKGGLGRIVKVNEREWNDVADSENENYFFVFAHVRTEGKRIILRDQNRNIELEIDQDQKRIWWKKEGLREFLYRIICAEYESA